MIKNTGELKMKHLKKTILITLVATLLTGCCWTDHSKTIKEVAEPMREKIATFYKKNKRYPYKEERDSMLKDVGCDINENDKCSIGWHTLKVDKPDIYNDYVKFSIEKSRCSFSLYKDGDVGKIGKCIQGFCLHMGGA
jgi:hypothetical protein